MPKFIADVERVQRFSIEIEAADVNEATERAGTIALPTEADSTHEELFSVRLASVSVV